MAPSAPRAACANTPPLFLRKKNSLYPTWTSPGATWGHYSMDPFSILKTHKQSTHQSPSSPDMPVSRGPNMSSRFGSDPQSFTTLPLHSSCSPWQRGLSDFLIHLDPGLFSSSVNPAALEPEKVMMVWEWNALGHRWHTMPSQWWHSP